MPRLLLNGIVAEVPVRDLFSSVFPVLFHRRHVSRARLFRGGRSMVHLIDTRPADESSTAERRASHVSSLMDYCAWEPRLERGRADGPNSWETLDERVI